MFIIWLLEKVSSVVLLFVASKGKIKFSETLYEDTIDLRIAQSRIIVHQTLVVQYKTILFVICNLEPVGFINFCKVYIKDNRARNNSVKVKLLKM